MLDYSIAIRQEGFIWWIKDLSRPDTIAVVAGWFPLRVLHVMGDRERGRSRARSQIAIEDVVGDLLRGNAAGMAAAVGAALALCAAPDKIAGLSA